MVKKSAVFKARREMHWSQEEAAKHADVSTRTIYRSEHFINYSRIMYMFWLSQPISAHTKELIMDEMEARERPYG